SRDHLWCRLACLVNVTVRWTTATGLPPLCWVTVSLVLRRWRLGSSPRPVPLSLTVIRTVLPAPTVAFAPPSFTSLCRRVPPGLPALILMIRLPISVSLTESPSATWQLVAPLHVTVTVAAEPLTF